MQPVQWYHLILISIWTRLGFLWYLNRITPRNLFYNSFDRFLQLVWHTQSRSRSGTGRSWAKPSSTGLTFIPGEWAWSRIHALIFTCLVRHMCRMRMVRWFYWGIMRGREEHWLNHYYLTRNWTRIKYQRRSVVVHVIMYMYIFDLC